MARPCGLRGPGPIRRAGTARFGHRPLRRRRSGLPCPHGQVPARAAARGPAIGAAGRPARGRGDGRRRGDRRGAPQLPAPAHGVRVPSGGSPRRARPGSAHARRGGRVGPHHARPRDRLRAASTPVGWRPPARAQRTSRPPTSAAAPSPRASGGCPTRSPGGARARPPRARSAISDKVRGMPGWVLDYVLLHELAHLIEPGHGPAFWSAAERLSAPGACARLSPGRGRDCGPDPQRRVRGMLSGG